MYEELIQRLREHRDKFATAGDSLHLLFDNAARALEQASLDAKDAARVPLTELAEAFEAMHARGDKWISTVATAALVYAKARAHGIDAMSAQPAAKE